MSSREYKTALKPHGSREVNSESYSPTKSKNTITFTSTPKKPKPTPNKNSSMTSKSAAKYSSNYKKSAKTNDHFVLCLT